MAARRFAPSILRVALATTATVAITYQLAVLHERGTLRVGNFFSFFTIQSNVLAVCLLALLAIVRKEERTPTFDAARGAVTLFISTTGVVFALLLEGHQETVQTAVPWVDTVVHKVIPAAVFLDWLLDPPRHRLPWRTVGLWLTYPAAWFAYTLVRGAVEGWYPYPFVDVHALGYGGVLGRAAILLPCFAAAAVVVAWIGNRRVGAAPRSALAT